MSITNRRWPFIAAIVVLIVHGAVVFKLGVIVPPDSVMFARWADLLIANQFDVAAVVQTTGRLNVPAGMYMFFVMLVVLAKLIAGAKWATVFVAANLVCDALTAAILIHMVILARRSTAAALLAIIAWLVCFDLVTWVRMPLTDVFFLFSSFAAFASLAAPRLAGRALTKKSLTCASLLTVTTLFLRPVGFLWLVLVPVVYLVVSGRVRLRPVVAVGLLVAAVAFAGHTLVVRYPERWPIAAFAKSVRWDARSYQRGDVIDARPETYHRPPSTLADYAAITADRFVYFFAFMTASFSRVHKVAGAAFYCPLYLLALAAFIAAARRGGDTGKIIILSAMIVLVVAFWHSLVIIDFDWRYRLPVLPHLIFMAACGLALLMRGEIMNAPDQATTTPPTPSRRSQKRLPCAVGCRKASVDRSYRFSLRRSRRQVILNIDSI